MRTVIWVILLFVAAVVSAAVLSQNDGLVSIFYSGYRIDTSLNVAVVALVLFVIVLYVALKAINGLLSMSSSPMSETGCPGRPAHRPGARRRATPAPARRGPSTPHAG